MKQATDILEPSPPPISPLATLETAAIRMRDLRTSFLPVCEEGSVFGRLVGVVTDRDIVIRSVAEGRDGIFSRVADAMSRPAITCGADSSLDDLTALFADHPFRYLPVLDRAGRLAGMVSRQALKAVQQSTVLELSDQ